MGAKHRVALYGGTFDPVHLGHLEIARGVSELFEIEKVVFIPAQHAPHKLGRQVTVAIHRYAMLALATQNDPKLLISTFELDDPARRYTVDTISHFQRVWGETKELFFIMGADSWDEITTWREWERLLKITNHIVATRPGYEINEPPLNLQNQIVDLRGGSQSVRQLTQLTTGAGIFLTDVVMNDVSATAIRHLASEGRIDELVQLVPESVAEYITKYQIYRNSNEA